MRHNRRFRDDIRATKDFLARFGFVLFIAIVFMMLTIVVAFGQRSKRQATDPLKEEQTKISMGDTYLQQGNGGMAVSSYEDAALLVPTDALPHYKIGNVYLRSKNTAAAMEAFQKAVTVDPTYARAYKEIAELYYMQKNGTEAVKAQEKYIALTGDEGLVRLGYYLFMTRDFARTNATFEKAYQKKLLKDADLRYYALSLVEAGDYLNGKKIFEEYLPGATEESAADYASYGKALAQLRQDSLAAISLERSLSIDNRQTSVKKVLWETLYSLGKTYYASKRFADADTTFEKLINLHPGVITGYVWAGRANACLDPETEKGLAKDFYEKVIEIGQAAPEKSKNDLKEAYSYLGYYYYVKKQPGESKLNWNKVLSIDPQDERALEALKTIKQ